MADLHPEDASFAYAVYAYDDAACRGPGVPVPAGVCFPAAADGPWRAWQILVDDDLRAVVGSILGTNDVIYIR